MKIFQVTSANGSRARRFMRFGLLAVGLLGCSLFAEPATSSDKTPSLNRAFISPPDSARPGVYWYFLDGNRDPKAMTADLEAMAKAGIGSVLFLEVDLGTPRGPVSFMSDTWQDMFVHAVRETERLGLELILGSGPGWNGSGGPWVKGEESMQHLVASTVTVRGPSRFQAKLPVPRPRKPFFDTVTPELSHRREEFYADVAVLAFPTPVGSTTIFEPDEKALYYRAPYTSQKGVKPYLSPPVPLPAPAPGTAIAKDKVIDLTSRLQPDGALDWEAPEGDWTIMRFGARNNGSNTRPAPQAGYGFECDKFSAAALDAHLANYTDKLLKKVGPRKPGAGWTMMHIDSWEMGAQNWTPNFRREFKRRRGYDPLPFYPAYTGRIVENTERTERFLWDMRQTAQELVIENHAGHLKRIAHRHGMGLSIEPYDMNPTADLSLGAVADVPMGEFWANTFNASFSCLEAASVAHTMGRPVVGAESFTSVEPFILYPASLKNQADWAFGAGINRIIFHTFQHQPLGPGALPGMTFGPYGVNWQRNQTWWPMVDGFHRYLARCSHLLRQGVTVADILYLTPEGAPQVFRAPDDALAGENPVLPDRRGYNFDGCAPDILISRAEARDGRIVFPGGTAYRVLVLPAVETMTPALTAKIASLARQGATIVGTPPHRSPSLSGYPSCDGKVRTLAKALWGGGAIPDERTERRAGKGRIFWGGDLRVSATTTTNGLYPSYAATDRLLRDLRLSADFNSDGSIRYTHRQTAGKDIYFVANRDDKEVRTECVFRVDAGAPELWDPVVGDISPLPVFTRKDGRTSVPLKFDAYQSYFVVFPRGGKAAIVAGPSDRTNFPEMKLLGSLDGSWEVSFQAGRGAPDRVAFDKLEDWTAHAEPGIRYFSGVATYRKTFDLPSGPSLPPPKSALFLDLGVVKDICRVRLNGRDLGVVWTAPWRVSIGDAVKPEGNRLEIEVANRWPNRLIGDRQPADANARALSWDSGLLGGKAFKTGRYTFVTEKSYDAKSPLLSSGLLGPVSLQSR